MDETEKVLDQKMLARVLLDCELIGMKHKVLGLRCWCKASVDLKVKASSLWVSKPLKLLSYQTFNPFDMSGTCKYSYISW